MNRISTTDKIVLAFGLVIAELVGLPVQAEQSKKTSRLDPAQKSPARAELWKSETTGKLFRVRIENDVLYSEWANIPPAVARQGAYIRARCRRVGTKWIGTSQIYLPCSLGEGPTQPNTSWCHLTMGMEINSLTSHRIGGRIEDPKRFDCQHCEVPETVWKNFVWVRKR